MKTVSERKDFLFAMHACWRCGFVVKRGDKFPHKGC